MPAQAYQRLQIQQQMLQAQRNVSGPIRQQEQQVGSLFNSPAGSFKKKNKKNCKTCTLNIHHVYCFFPRLHVQSITCSSRSNSTSVSWPRPCWWSSSNSNRPLPTQACTLVEPNPPWIHFQVIPRLQASLTCRPKSRSHLLTPTAPTLSVSSFSIALWMWKSSPCRIVK